MKKNLVKKLIAGTLGLVTALSTTLAGVGTEVAHAEAFTETEPNDTNVTANAILLNQTYDATLGTAKDVDWFKFEVTERGYFQVKLEKGATADTAAIGRGWDMTVYRADATTSLDAGANYIQASYETQKEPFEAGIYYVKVCATWDGSAPTAQPYELTVNFTADENWEVENNDVNSKATTIATNKEVKAHLFNSKDVDWFKYSTTAAGIHSISLRIDETAEVDNIRRGWNIQLYDSNYKFIREWDYIDSSYTTANLPMAKGTYFIRVCATWDGAAPDELIYNLKANFTATTAWETENNDLSSKANVISLNKTYKGVFYKKNDVDWYKFTVKSAGRVCFDFKADASVNIEKLGRGWKVSVYKSTNATKEVATKDWINTAEKVRLTMDLSAGTYLVKVEPTWDGSSPVDEAYTIRANYALKPAAVSLTSVKAGTKSAKLTWKKVTNATGYIVYRSTSKSGKYTKVATISKNTTLTYTNSKLTKGKTYYYYVVSYRTENGVTAYGTKSKVLAVKAK